MEKADALLRVISPEIDAKCAEIKQKKGEKLLTRLFAAALVLMLTVPVLLIFFGISPIMVFVPIVYIGVVFLASLPILISKGEEYCE